MQTAEQRQEHVEYLLTIGRGGQDGVMPLLKTTADHDLWENNMRWFAKALYEGEDNPKTA